MKRRAIRAWEAFWPSLLVWLPALSVYIWADWAIPDVQDARITIAILALMIEFLIVEFILMIRNYIVITEGERDYTAMSLISVSAGLALVFLVVLGLFINRDWALAHPDTVRRINNVSRLVAVFVLGWGFYQLLAVEQVARPERLTKRGFIITAILILQCFVVWILYG